MSSMQPSAEQCGLLVIKWFHFLSLAPQDKQTQQYLVGARSLMTQIFTNRPSGDAKSIGYTTKALLKSIQNSAQMTQSAKDSAIVSLINLEDALVTEMLKVTAEIHNQNVVFQAEIRPVLFAVGGSAAFVAAVIFAEPILAFAIAASEASSLPIAVGQVGTTAAIAGVTLMTPKILTWMGGKAIQMAGAKSTSLLAMTGNGLVRTAGWVDEVALFTVVGLVGIGGAYELFEAGVAFHEGYKYSDLIAEIDRSLIEANSKKIMI